jgi:hypothetical protein
LKALAEQERQVSEIRGRGSRLVAATSETGGRTKA